MAAQETKVFVGGIPFGIDQHTIKEDFMRFGEIEDVFLPTDRETGKLRGFAFVTYRNSKDAHDAAGSMHGRDYHGRQITVNIAKPRDPTSEGKGKGKGDGGPPAGTSSYSYSRPRDYERGYDDRQRYAEDRNGGREGPGADRERDHHDAGDDDRFTPRYSHGNSYDGSGKYAALGWVGA